MSCITFLFIAYIYIVQQGASGAQVSVDVAHYIVYNYIKFTSIVCRDGQIFKDHNNHVSICHVSANIDTFFSIEPGTQVSVDRAQQLFLCACRVNYKLDGLCIRGNKSCIYKTAFIQHMKEQTGKNVTELHG